MSSNASSVLLMTAAAVGIYVLYKKGVFGGTAHTVTGAAGKNVDYLNPADATSDKRPSAAYLVKPYQIFNPGGGMRPFEIDAGGGPTNRQLVLPGESSSGLSPASYVLVGVESIHAGYFAGRGGGGRGRQHHEQQQQEQQEQEEEMMGGEDPYQQRDHHHHHHHQAYRR